MELLLIELINLYPVPDNASKAFDMEVGIGIGTVLALLLFLRIGNGQH